MAAGCQLFYRKIYGYFLQCGNHNIALYINIISLEQKRYVRDRAWFVRLYGEIIPELLFLSAYPKAPKYWDT